MLRGLNNTIVKSQVGSPYLSVVIPCYNEENNLVRGVLSEVKQTLSEKPFDWEVIIVNDESTDKSRDLIEKFIIDTGYFSLYDIPHGGKPSAVWAGIQRARGDLVLFTDMDQSTPISELDKLLPWFEKEFDVVIGSRGDSREGFTLLRKLGSFAFRILRQSILLRNIKDTQCGFKACRREAALKAFPRLQFFRQDVKTEGWKVSAFDVELLFIFEHMGYLIKEVDVDWENRDQSNTKQMARQRFRYGVESIEMAREVIRVFINQTKGLYDDL